MKNYEVIFTGGGIGSAALPPPAYDVTDLKRTMVRSILTAVFSTGSNGPRTGQETSR